MGYFHSIIKNTKTMNSTPIISTKTFLFNATNANPCMLCYLGSILLYVVVFIRKKPLLEMRLFT